MSFSVALSKKYTQRLTQRRAIIQPLVLFRKADGMSIILFLVGLILLFKGEFTLSNRRFPRERVRTAAIFLMIPAAFDLCAGFYIGINLTDGQTMDMDALIDAISNP